MKISILTQPLGHNYGGLLQAYALQRFLANQGWDVETLDRRAPKRHLKVARQYLSNLARFALGRIQTVPTGERTRFVFQHLADFRDRHMNVSRPISSEKELRQYYSQNDFGAVVVGSDQVWRPRYSPSLLNFYLDFLDDVGSPAKRISYAASFGVSDWEYTPKQTSACGLLIRKFDAVSVREESAVEQCRMRFGVTPECVVDPTMLLSAQEYEALIPGGSSVENAGQILVYLLDSREAKQAIVKAVSRTLGRGTFSAKPDKTIKQVAARDLQACQYPKVEQWLKGFRDAGFVVTDSFHGCVFATIFNKPFIAIGNAERGLSRFKSLLGMFGLEDRLVASVEDLDEEVLSAAIDWDFVNKAKQDRVEWAKAFLLNSVSRESSVSDRNNQENGS